MKAVPTSRARSPFAMPALIVVLGFVIAAALPAQNQPNSAAASLTINGQSGVQNIERGSTVALQMSGTPNAAALFFVGPDLAPPRFTPAGILNVFPNQFLLDGTMSAQDRLDGSGNLVRNFPIPWFAPSGLQLFTQGAVEDTASSLGFTLTAPSDLTVTPNQTVVPQEFFFDPTTGANGVPTILPPAGTQPGDLPTLDSFGSLAPPDVFVNNRPVHNVFQSPFDCNLCHGAAPEMFPAWSGSMMANATRDPLFDAQFAIAVAGMEMLQQNGLSEHGGELAADFCIRCHSPAGWQGGRSGFRNDGVTAPFEPDLLDHQHGIDLEGVSCDVCHRATGAVQNVSPSAFATPGQPESSQLVFSPTLTKRGPFPGTRATSYPGGTTAYGAHVPPASASVLPPVAHNPPAQEGTAFSPFHTTEESAFHSESALCGSCHNISNPVTGHAIERTYTEWLDSDFGDPASSDFQTCQDCHMPALSNRQVCSLGGQHPAYGAFNKVRGEVKEHSLVGANAWIPQILKQMYPLVDQPWTNGNNYAGTFYSGPASRNAAYDAATAAAYQMHRSAADVDLMASEPVPGTISAMVRVTNKTGHKLPTGYPEGRQMWVQVVAEDANGTPIYQSGMMDPVNRLIRDPDIKVYETKQGLNYPTLGLSGSSFHFVLNNTIEKDNRILPKGFTQTPGFGGTDSYDPVQAPWPQGGLYPDGQHWDDTPYTIAVPPGTARPIKVTATVFYQTSSLEYIEFLAAGGDPIAQTLPHQDALTLLTLWYSGFPAPAVPVGEVGAMSTSDPASPHTNQTAMVVIP